MTERFFLYAELRGAVGELRFNERGLLCAVEQNKVSVVYFSWLPSYDFTLLSLPSFEDDFSRLPIFM